MSSPEKDRKTEKPTRRKFRELRKKGQVARSQEIVSATLTILIFAYFYLSWEFQLERFKQIVILPTAFLAQPFSVGLKQIFNPLFESFILLVIPFAGLVFFGGILSNILQFGVLFAVEPLKPDFNKLNPIKGLKKIFSAKNLVESLKTIVKVLLLSSVLAFVVAENINDLIEVPYCNLSCLVILLNELSGQIAMYAAVLFIVLAALDYFFQKFNFTKENMMTKEESKRERKDTEGNPVNKGRRKNLHKDLALDDAVERVKRAAVVITTTRTAIAVQFDRGTQALPVIVALGKGLLAKQITDIANKENVALVENAALAFGLIEMGKIDRFVPLEFIEETARVLRRAAG